MRNKKSLILSFILVATLMLGIGYAAISNIDLTINGTASATTSDENFKVKFEKTVTPSDPDKVTASVTDDLTATLNVTGLKSVGDTVTATYKVTNASNDISASMAVPVITNDNGTYFEVTTNWTEVKKIAKDNTEELTVTVKLIKTPITDDEEAKIAVKLTATPVEP